MADYKKITPSIKDGFEIREGDVFISSTLGEVAFLRWKRGQKSYMSKQLSTGDIYTTRTSFFSFIVEVVGHYVDEKKDDKDILKKGDLFVIQSRPGKSAELFVFERYERNKIFARNPIDNGKWTLGDDFTCTLVSRFTNKVVS